MGVVIKRNLDERARRIAYHRGIPKNTVETVIKDYIKGLQQDAVNGERILIEGVMSVSVIHNLSTDEFVPQGRVSEVLKQMIREGNAPQPTAATEV